MTKVVKFPSPVIEKFGPQRVRRKQRGNVLEKMGQLNMFAEAKVVNIRQLSAFEEALLHDEQGDVSVARTYYRKAIDRRDSIGDAYCNLGIIEFQEKRYPQAIDGFTKCLQEEPRHFEAHYNLANLYAEKGDMALSKFHYEVAIEIDPDFANSYFNLALIYAREKDYDQAIDILNQYKTIVSVEEHTQVDNLIANMRSVAANLAGG